MLNCIYSRALFDIAVSLDTLLMCGTSKYKISNFMLYIKEKPKKRACNQHATIC